MKSLTAIAVALLMVFSSVALALAPGMSEDSFADAPEAIAGSGVHSITYHSGVDDRTATVSYNGIASTEYNPLYWAGSFTDASGDPAENWVAPTVSEEESIKVYKHSSSSTLTFWTSRNNSNNVNLTVNVMGPEVLSASVSGISNGSINGDSSNKDIPVAEDGRSFSFIAKATSRNTAMRCTLNLTLGYELHGVSSKVFAGWSTVDHSDVYMPGDVVPNSIKDLYAVWAVSDLFVSGVPTIDADNITDPSGTTATHTIDATASGITATDVMPLYDASSITSQKNIAFAEGRTAPNMYTTQYKFVETFPLGSITLPTGSYRSDVNASGMPTTTITIDGVAKLGGDVIIDNLYMNGEEPSNTHGMGGNKGLFANGHILILGTGIDTTSTSEIKYLPQVFGGTQSGGLTGAVIQGKKIVSETLGDLTVDLGTCLIIHSGKYYNVVGGSLSNSIGSASSGGYRSVYTVLKGGHIMDTFCGGNATDGVIHGSAGSTYTSLQGGVFSYATGVTMRGDYWEETTSYNGTVDEAPSWWKTYRVPESTIFEGAGGKSCELKGASHVFLSDKASVYDVQGGTRAHTGVTTFTFLEISGSALVKHVACGTITDGNAINQGDAGNQQSVGGVEINVVGDPKVAAIYGAGYDTFYKADYTTMMRGTIDVNIHGGTFGSVYGGGYRGYVGVDNNNSADKVNVNVTLYGGTVIHSVYGGGRGGVDKVVHTPEGLNSWGDSHKDSTGKSYIYGDVRVVIRGGTVGGNVYGGGESVPMLYSYIPQRYSTSYRVNDGGFTSEQHVAQVVGTTTVQIHGGTVNGSVYGAGKGISLSQFDNPAASRSTSDNFDSTNYVITSDGTVKKQEWQYYNTASPYSTYVLSGAIRSGGPALDYSTYARVTGGSQVQIQGGTVVGSVYGGGAYGLSSASSATVSGGTVGADVYGGGYGEIDKNSVTGASSSTVSGGSVAGSVYGGCAFGITAGNSSATISGGSVDGDVFGGGLGESGHNSVTGTSSVTISGGIVDGTVYGGCSLGITLGNCTVRFTGGTVSGNVFAGGLGTSGYISSKSKRFVYITGGVISGSVYGGSSMGDDAQSASDLAGTLHDEDSDAFIVLTSGTVYGSIYGGGYRGSTTGGTHIFIGYSDEAGTKSSGGDIVIGNSVYGGGDIGELGVGEQAFTRVMVYGGSAIKVNGASNLLSFSGSLSGAGNSCLTGGGTSIAVDDVSLPGTMESIHRADDVEITRSNLGFSGRVSGESDNTKYSFYRIERLSFIGGTTAYLYAPMNEVTGYYSCSTGPGAYTMSSSPMNRIYICNGTMFEVRRTVSGNLLYGDVVGYTILSIETVEDYYGAFALASTGSVGGFVIETDGTYAMADITDFTTCRCWFIAGVLQTSSSSTLVFDSNPAHSTVDDGGQYITIPTLSTSTSLRYSGGYFTPSTAGLYSIGAGVGPSCFTVKAGTNTLGRADALLLRGGDGTFVPNQPNDYYEIILSEVRPIQPVLQVTVSGQNVNVNAYLGYVTIYVQEVVPVHYRDEHGEDVTDYLIQNKIELRIDMYRESDGTDVPDYDVVIKTVGGEGSGDAILPSRLNDHSVYLTGVETNVSVDSSEGAGLFVATVKNNGSTDGWNSPPSRYDITGGLAGSVLMQTLTGGYQATIRVSVVGFASDVMQTATLTFALHDSNGVRLDNFTITVEVLKQDPVNVTFRDDKQGIVRNYSFEYGSRITEADGPSTMDAFVGWYEDPEYYNKYNFNIPLRYDITLYARYMYTVTFDNMNGTTSVMYVRLVAGGLTIMEPDDPTWEGFIFDGWYKDIDHVIPWDFDEDKVVSDIRLYAKWAGEAFYVKFKYSLDEGQTYQYLMDGGSEFKQYTSFGSTYGVGIDTATNLLKAMPEFVATGNKFIRWQLNTSDTTSVGIYGDTVVTQMPTDVDPVTEERYFDVYAQLARNAVNIILHPNTSDLTAKITAPTDFLVFPDAGGLYSFYGNNATRTGYRVEGWSTDAGGLQNYHVLSDEWSMTQSQVDAFPEVDGVRTVELYAKWVKIEYTVTIVDPAGGVIDAYHKGVRKTQITATYGEEITLSYTAGDGFSFNRWYINGQGVLADAASSSTTLTVIGSCAVYVQLRGLEPATVRLYLDGGSGDSPPAVNLYLSEDGSTPYVKFIRQSVASDEGGRYYGEYNISSKTGVFRICIMGADNRLIDVGSISVVDGGSMGIVHAVSVTSTVTGASLVDLPSFSVPGASIDIVIPDHYEAVGNLWFDYDSEHRPVTGDAIAIPENVDTGVVVSGELKLVDHTVIYSPVEGFEYRFGSDAVTSSERQHGAAIGSPPTVYDAGGVEVGTPESDYKLTGWYYDDAYSMPVSAADTVEADATIYPLIVERDSVQYTVEIFLYGLDGQKPEMPTYVVTPSGFLGGVTTYVPIEYTGFTLITEEEAYTDFILSEHTEIVLEYERASASAEIVFGAAEASMPGWEVHHGAEGYYATKTVFYDEVIALPSLSLEGHTHTGWTVGADGDYTGGTYRAVDLSNGVLLFPDPFEANFSRNEYAVTLNTPYGEFSEGVKSISFGVPYGDPIDEAEGFEAPDPPAGYTFAGWKSGETAFDAGSPMPAHDLVLTAHWNINRHTVSFEGDAHVRISATSGGDTFESGESLDYGVGVVLTILFDSNYTMGSRAPADLGAVNYTSRQDYTWTFTVPDDDVAITIASIPSQYRVYFVVDGAEDPSIRINATEGETRDISGVRPSKDMTGMEFHGWYSDNKYTSPATVFEDISDDHTVYGWTEFNTYTVAFDGNGGTGSMGSIDCVYGTDYNLPANTFAKSGSIFFGWALSSDGTAAYPDAGSFSNLTDGVGTVMLYAIWYSECDYSGTYDGAPHSAALSGGSFEAYYSETVLTAENHATAGSTTPIAYIDAGERTVYYYAKCGGVAASGSLSVSIARAHLTVEVDDVESGVVYDGSRKYATATIEGCVESETAMPILSFGGGGNYAVDAGVYEVTVHSVTISGGQGKISNYDVEKISGSYAISPKPVTITVNSIVTGLVYDGTAKTTDAEVSGLVGSDALTYQLSYSDNVNAGTCTVTVARHDFTAGIEGNYSVDYIGGTMAISPKPVTITVNSIATGLVYDGTAKTTDAAVSELVGSDALTYRLSYSDNVNAGTCTVAVESYDFTTGIRSNYYVTGIPGTIAIGKASITVRSDDASKTYDGVPLTRSTGQLRSGVLGTGDALVEFTTTGTITDFIDGGVPNTLTGVRIMRGETDATGNYDISYEHGTLTIVKRALTITADSGSRGYDGLPFAIGTYSLSGPAMVAGHSVEVVVTGSQTGVGSSANVASDAVIKDGARIVTGNYSISYVEGTLEVTTRAITISANSATKVYDGAALSDPGCSVTSGSLVAGHEVHATVSGSQTFAGSSVNSIDSILIRDAGGNDVSGFYDATPLNGTLTVTPREVTYTSATAVKTYDGTPLEARGEPVLTGELASGDVLFSWSITGSITAFGSTYNTIESIVIKRGSEIVTGSYSITKAPGTLTVERRAITVAADSGDKTYDGTPLVESGYSVTSEQKQAEGHVVHATVNGSQTTAGSSTNVISGIRIEDASHNDVTINYLITPVNGTLTVAEAVVDWPSIASKDYTGGRQYADIPAGRYSIVSNEGGIDAGTYPVSLRLSDPGNYRWADTEADEKTVADAFRIEKAANPVINALNIADWTYGGTASDPSGETTFGTVEFSYAPSLEGPFTSEKPSEAGDYYVKAHVPETVNYDGWEVVKQFRVNKAAYDMSHAAWDYASAFTYDKTVKTVSVAGLPSGITVKSYEGNTGTDAGDYRASVVLDYDKRNYVAPSMPILNWRIDARQLTVVSWGDLEFEYDETPKTVAAAMGGMMPGDDVVFVFEDAVETIVGNYTARITGIDGASTANYLVPVDSTSADWRIVKGTFACDVDGYAGAYDGQYHGITVAPGIAGVTVLYGTSESHIADAEAPVRKDAVTLTVWFKATKSGYNDVTGSATVEISKAVLTVTADIASKTYGEAAPSFGYTWEGQVSGETPLFTGAPTSSGSDAGTYDVMAGTLVMVDNGGFKASNYEMVFEGAGKYTIGKRSVTLTSLGGEWVYDGSEHTAGVEESGYGWATGEGAAYDTTKVVDVGSVKNTFAYTPKAGTNPDNYNITKVETALLTVTSASIVYTSAGYSGIYDASSHGMSVVPTTHGTVVTYRVGEEYVAEKPMFKDAGTYVVHFRIEKANYNTVDGSETVAIQKKAVTVTARNSAVTYGDAPSDNGFTHTALAGTEEWGSVVTGVVTYGHEYVRYGDVGSYGISPVVTGLIALNYTFASADGTLTVNPKEIGIEWGSTEFVYNKTSQEPSASATGEVNGDVIGLTVSVAGEHIDAGSYEASATAITGAKAGNYALPSNTVGFSIAQKTVGLSWSEVRSFVYDGAAHTLTATATGLEDGDTCTVVVSGSGTTVDDYTATAESLGNTNYKLPEIRTQAFEVTNAVLTGVVVDGYDGVYDGNLHNIVASRAATSVASQTVSWRFSADGTKWHDSIEKSLVSDSGTYRYEASAANHETKAGTFTVTISKATISMSGVSFVGKSVMFNGTEQVLEITGSLPANVSVGYQDNRRTSVGSTTARAVFTIEVSVKDNYNAIPDMTAILTITPAGIDHTATSVATTYDGHSHSIDLVVEGGVTVTYSTDGTVFDLSAKPAFTDAGVHTTWYKLEKADHETVVGSSTVTIRQRDATVGTSSGEKFYDSTPLVKYGLTLAGAVEGHTVQGTVTGTITDYVAGGVVNTCDRETIRIMDGEVDVTDNYNISYAEGRLTIIPREVFITANNHAIAYGEPGANSGFTATGFVDGQGIGDIGDLRYSYPEYDATKPIGEYDITLSIVNLKPKADNYRWTLEEGTLTVVQREVAVEWGVDAFEYNASEQKPVASIVGAVNGDILEVEVAGGKTNVGIGYTATATAITGEKSGNYVLSGDPDKSFSIAPATITVTANDVINAVYGDDLIQNGVVYKGFKGSDDKTVISGTLSYTYTYELYDPVTDDLDPERRYTITPDVDGLRSEHGNYVFEPVSGEYVVNPRVLAITWSATDPSANIMRMSRMMMLASETISLTYNGGEQKPFANLVNLVNNDEVTPVLEGSGINVGIGYTTSVSSLSGEDAGNYVLPDVEDDRSTVFDIVKAMLTVTAKPHSITYGEGPSNAGVDYYGFVNGQDATVLGGTLSYDYTYSRYDPVTDPELERRYCITPKGYTSDNYDFDYESGELTVGKATIASISIEVYDGKYDGAGHEVVGSHSAVTVNGQGMTWEFRKKGTEVWKSLEDVTVKDVADSGIFEYRITAPNHNPAMDEFVASVHARNVTLRSCDLEETYSGQEWNKHEVEVGEDGFVDGEEPEYIYDIEWVIDAGEYENKFTYVFGEDVDEDNYIIAEPVFGWIIINPRTVTLTVYDGTYDYDGHVKKADVGESGLVGEDEVSYEVGYRIAEEELNSDGVVDAGRYIAYIESAEISKGKPDNYTLVYDDTGALTINKAVREISWSAYGFTFNGSEQKSVASFTDVHNNRIKLQPSYTGVRFDGTADDDSIHAGVYHAEVGETEHDSNYLLTNREKDYRIERMAVTTHWITNGEPMVETGDEVLGDPFIYDRTSRTLTAYFQDVGMVRVDLQVSCPVEAVNVGIHEARADVSGINDYDFGGHDVVRFEIDPRPIGLEWSDTSLIYNGAPQKPVAKATGVIEGDACNVIVSGEKTDAGTYTAVAESIDNPNYVLPDERTNGFVIDRRTVTLVSGTQTWIYTGDIRSLDEVTAKGDGFVDGEGFTAETDATIRDAGEISNTFTYTLNPGTNIDNYIITPKYGSLIVDAAELQVTANAVTGTYGDDYPEFTYVYSTVVDGKKPGFKGSLSSEGRNVGVHDILKWTLELVDKGDFKASNYKLVFNGESKLTIVPRVVELTSYSYNDTYDGCAHTGEVKVTSEKGFLEGEAPEITSTYRTDVTEGTVVNEFTWRFSDPVTEGNYEVIQGGKGTITIGKAVLTVTAKAAGKTYGDSDPDSLEYEASGAVEGETPGFTGTLSIPAGMPAGTYNISEGSLALDDNGSFKASNYEIDFDGAGCYVVAKRAVTIASGNHSKEYDGDSISTDVSKISVIEGGFAAGEWFEVDEISELTDVGKIDNVFTIKPQAGTDLENNYDITPVYGELEVTPAELTVTAIDIDVKYGETIEYEYKPDGVVKGQIPGFDGSPSSVGRNVGTYTITKGTLSLEDNGSFKKDNYAMVFVEGELTIKRASVVMESASDSKPYDGRPLVTNEVSSTGFAYGEGARFVVTGSQTEVGESENIFKYELFEGTNPDNYDFHTVYGTLTVDKKGLSESMVRFQSSRLPYTGEEMSVVFEIRDVPEGSEDSIITEDDYVVSGTLSAVRVGTYKIRVDATESGNYCGYVEVEWHISAKLVPVPVAVQGAVYTGEPITVVGDDAEGRYTVEGGTAVDAGEHVAVVTLTDPNYAWQEDFDGEITYTIGKATFNVKAKGYSGEFDGEYHGSVESREAVFNGESVTGASFKYSTNDIDWFDEMPLVRDVCSLEIYVKAVKDNFNDSSSVKVDAHVWAKRVIVPVPRGELRYDGTVQTALFDTDDYTVIGGSATNMGIYTAEVSLRDKANTMWDDGGNEKKYVGFEILGKEFTILLEAYTGFYDGQAHDAVIPVDLSGASVLYSLGTDYSGDWSPSIPRVTDSGVYTISYAASKDNYENYQGSIEVVVSPASVPRPSAMTGLVYDGKPKIALEETDLFEVENGTAVKAGKHVATVALKDKRNHVWAGGVDSEDLAIEYEILKAMLNITFRPYSDMYDARDHYAVSIIDDSDASITYSRDNKDWYDSVPLVKDVEDAGRIYIKASKEGYHERIYPTEIVIRPAVLTIDILEVVTSVSDGNPRFDFSISGILEGDSDVRETMESLLGSDYEPWKDSDGLYVLYSINDVINRNYIIQVFNGVTHVGLDGISVDWDRTKYSEGVDLSEMVMVIEDSTGAKTPIVVPVRDSTHGPAGDEYDGLVDLTKGFDVYEEETDDRNSALEEMMELGSTYNIIFIIALICIAGGSTYFYMMWKKRDGDDVEEELEEEE